MFENYDVNDRHQIRFDVVIETLSPLSHIGESIGNQSNLKTLDITDLTGESNPVFVYSSNSLRNGLFRRKGTLSMLDDLDLTVNPTTHQTLFAGGFIEGGTAVDLELDAKVRKFLPSISVLGTAKPPGLFNSNNSQMIGGRINIGGAYLVCLETAEYIYKSFPPLLPYSVLSFVKELVEAKQSLFNDRVNAWLYQKQISGIQEKVRNYQELLLEYMPLLEDKLRSYTQWLTYNQKVRMDSLKDPHLAQYINSNHQIGGQQTSLLSESKPDKKKGKSSDEKHSQQMIMGDWLLQPGATLYSRWDGNITDVEEGMLAAALLKFAESPYLGGKCGTGCGLVSFDIYYRSGQEAGKWLTIAPDSQILSERCQENYQRYMQHLEQFKGYIASAKQDITKFLSERSGSRTQ